MTDTESSTENHSHDSSDDEQISELLLQKESENIKLDQIKDFLMRVLRIKTFTLEDARKNLFRLYKSSIYFLMAFLVGTFENTIDISFLRLKENCNANEKETSFIYFFLTLGGLVGGLATYPIFRETKNKEEKDVINFHRVVRYSIFVAFSCIVMVPFVRIIYVLYGIFFLLGVSVCFLDNGVSLGINWTWQHSERGLNMVFQLCYACIGLGRIMSMTIATTLLELVANNFYLLLIFYGTIGLFFLCTIILLFFFKNPRVVQKRSEIISQRFENYDEEDAKILRENGVKSLKFQKFRRFFTREVVRKRNSNIMMFCHLIFTFLIIGVEMSFPKIFFLFSTSLGILTEAKVSLLLTVFSIVFCTMRLFNVFLSYFIMSSVMLFVGTIGCIISLFSMFLLYSQGPVVLWVCTLLYAVSMSGVYPSIFSYSTQTFGIIPTVFSSTILIYIVNATNATPTIMINIAYGFGDTALLMLLPVISLVVAFAIFGASFLAGCLHRIKAKNTIYPQVCLNDDDKGPYLKDDGA